ncbi:MAG: NAD(+) diphosphatase [Lachnospiraceae bacterium]
MIQDIYPHKFDNQYKKPLPKPQDYLLVFENTDMYMYLEGDKERLPTYEQVCTEFPQAQDKIHASGKLQIIYLFSVDEKKFFLGLHLKMHDTKHLVKRNIQMFRELQPSWCGFAGITGHQLYKWYSDHVYCGRCAHPMSHKEDERALKCAKCGQIEYPKISPAIIVGVIKDNKILMSKYANRENKRYALLAGFSEIGETLEETVKREVMEEVGVKVKDITYYKNQPWAFSESLLVGFFARLEGSDKITLDETELEMANWFERKDIPKNDLTISLTAEMIETFRQNKVVFKTKESPYQKP